LYAEISNIYIDFGEIIFKYMLIILCCIIYLFFRTKACLYVSDLSKKDHRILKAKSRLYEWNLITVAVFYSLPVIQLVFTSQKVKNNLLFLFPTNYKN